MKGWLCVGGAAWGVAGAVLVAWGVALAELANEAWAWNEASSWDAATHDSFTSWGIVADDESAPP